jgi:hypothetical protein
MTASTLGNAAGTKSDIGAARGACALDLPRRSTRELEEVFARRDGRRPLVGLAVALTFSAATWVVLAVTLF